MERAWEHWNKLGAPKLIVAPMMDQSDLPFRMLCRKYSAAAAYTKEDRPLFVQFGATDPEMLLKAAVTVQEHCDYVDINLGCPQCVAKRGNYGAFLMEDLPLIQSMATHLATNLTTPVSCKIRIFPDAGGCRLLFAGGAWTHAGAPGRLGSDHSCPGRCPDPGAGEWQHTVAGGCARVHESDGC